LKPVALIADSIELIERREGPVEDSLPHHRLHQGQANFAFPHVPIVRDVGNGPSGHLSNIFFLQQAMYRLDQAAFGKGHGELIEQGRICVGIGFVNQASQTKRQVIDRDFIIFEATGPAGRGFDESGVVTRIMPNRADPTG
jgi:hypothetical protein